MYRRVDRLRRTVSFPLSPPPTEDKKSGLSLAKIFPGTLTGGLILIIEEQSLSLSPFRQKAAGPATLRRKYTTNPPNFLLKCCSCGGKMGEDRYKALGTRIKDQGNRNQETGVGNSKPETRNRHLTGNQ
jgi:hypothetical protein